jgi:hypothetical protein
MNYGKKSLRRRKNELNAKGEKRLKRGSLFISHLVLLAVIGAMIIGSFAAYGVLQGIIYKNPYEKGYRGLKVLSECLRSDIRPKAGSLGVPISVILRSNLVFFEEYI